MSTLLVSLELFSPDVRDLVKLYDEATHVDVQTHGTPHAPRRPFSTLRGIVVNGQRYTEKVASCSCAEIRLFKFGDEAYTLCADHGLQAIGYLRREIVRPASSAGVNGRKR